MPGVTEKGLLLDFKNLFLDLLLITKGSFLHIFIFSVDHDGRQTLHFGLSTNLTGQCLMSFGVIYTETMIKNQLTLSTNEEGMLELTLDNNDPIRSLISVTNGKLHQIAIIYKRGIFSLKINHSVSSTLRSVPNISFLHTPIKFCG